MSKFRPGGMMRDVPCFDPPGPLKRKEVPRCQDCGCGLDKKKSAALPASTSTKPRRSSSPSWRAGPEPRSQYE
jgi:hypothetical protein